MKWYKNPWILLGGAVAAYYVFLRPQMAGAVTTARTGLTPEQRQAQAETQARLNAQIDEVTTPRPGETLEEWEARQQAFSQMTGQPMMTMNI
jgi:hypothetical protein